MPSAAPPRPVTMLGALAVPALALVLAAMAPDEPPRAAAPVQQGAAANQPSQPPLYLGIDNCRRCHEDPRGEPTAFVQLTEYTVWKTEDKHSLAYLNLTGNRGKRMGEILGYDVARSPKCLNCHGLATVRKDQTTRQFRTANGVSCEGCHGPSERYEGRHSQEDWREVTAAEKAKLGMIDVRDPARRTQMCASCHIGSASEGKRVTHDMYAAGHPPLPGFEIATFSESLPRHWRLRKDVPYLKKAPAKIQERYDFANASFERTKLVVASSVIVLRESMTLLKNQTEAPRSAARSPSSPAWPEYAQFDCYACHHELKVPSWRQARGYAGPPGRPQIRPWPMALVELAVRHTAKNDAEARASLDQLKTARRQLEQACNQQPFGDPTQVSAAAGALAAGSGALVDKVQATSFDPASALRLLKLLCAMAAEQTPDYDTARQIAWAFDVIYAEWSPANPGAEQLRAIIDTLRADLHLGLNTARQQRQALLAHHDPLKEDLVKPLQQISNHELADSLRHISDYEPARFQNAMRTLAGLLPAR